MGVAAADLRAEAVQDIGPGAAGERGDREPAAFEGGGTAEQVAQPPQQDGDGDGEAALHAEPPVERVHQLRGQPLEAHRQVLQTLGQHSHGRAPSHGQGLSRPQAGYSQKILSLAAQLSVTDQQEPGFAAAQGGQEGF